MSEIIVKQINFKDELEHGIYVSCLARAIAKEMGLDKEMQDKMSISGLLHDIGKMKLVDYLYDYGEDSFMVERMKYARLHPTISCEIAKEYGYSEEIQDYIKWHHENYDGTGYPDQIAEDIIPLGARIIRVCDVFCALSSDRPYRKKFPVETAIDMMISEIQHFDMQVFLAFQRVMHNGFIENYEPIADKYFEE